MPFTADLDADGEITTDDMARMLKPRLDTLLKAVTERDDELLWNGMQNLSSAYALEHWEDPPTPATLLKLDFPIGIFHGELDGATRVEGARETRPAFRLPQTSLKGGSAAYRDAFDFAALVRH